VFGGDGSTVAFGCRVVVEVVTIGASLATCV